MKSAPDRTLVIFDCDGVLVDSEIVAARVLARELSAIGLAISAPECLARYTGLSMHAVVHRIEQECGRSLPADFLERVRAADAAAFATELRPVAGVREVVEALVHTKCIASSGRLAKMRFTLSLTDLLGFFAPHLFSAEMVKRGKPAPDLFLYAAERIGFAPEHCIVIEDSEAGVRAAVAAGMPVLGFAGASHCVPSHPALLHAAGALRVFTQMVDLPELLSDALALRG